MNGRRVRTDTPKDYTLQLLNEFEATETVTRPFAYLIPSTNAEAVATLKRHGLDVQELREDIELDLEVYKIDAIEVATSSRAICGRPEGEPSEGVASGARGHAAGSDGGTAWALAVTLLEPRSEDGLTTWNDFDSELKEGGDFPVSRLPRPVPISLTGAEPLADYREPPRPITFDMAGGGGRGRGGPGGFGKTKLNQ